MYFRFGLVTVSTKVYPQVPLRSVSHVSVPRDLPAALGYVLDHGDGRPAPVGGLGGGVRPAAAWQPRVRRRRESAAGEAPVHAAGVPAAPLGAHPGDDFAMIQ